MAVIYYGTHEIRYARECIVIYLTISRWLGVQRLPVIQRCTTERGCTRRDSLLVWYALIKAKSQFNEDFLTIWAYSFNFLVRIRHVSWSHPTSYLLVPPR